MNNECDKCGLDDIECHCYLYELEDRIIFLEEELEKVTQIVKCITDYLKKEE